MQPTVSVILPVYNAGRYLTEAIESILAQRFTDFEFIILDDGSTDDSIETIRRYTDPRIRVFQQPNQGLIASLNRLITLSHGRYLARMDQDDVALPDRLRLQVEVLEREPAIGLVGSWAQAIDQRGDFIGTIRYPVTDAILRATLALRNCFAHGAVMIRRTSDVAYSLDYVDAEDYELWCRLALASHVATIPRVLYQWRFHPTSISSTRQTSQTQTAERIRRQYARSLLEHSQGLGGALRRERQLRGSWPLLKLYASLVRKFPTAPLTRAFLPAFLQPRRDAS